MNTETLHFKFLKVFCCVLLLQLGWSHALGAVKSDPPDTGCDH